MEPGREVVGCLAAGLSVVACENDEHQYPYLVSRIGDMASKFEGKETTWHKFLPNAFNGSLGQKPSRADHDADDDPKREIDIE